MNYKWIGAILVVCSCTFGGFSMCTAFRREERELQSLLGALDYMICELQYRATALPDLCRQAAQDRGGLVGMFLNNLATELDAQNAPDVQSCIAASAASAGELPNRLRKAICILGASLGRFDLDGQLQGFETVRNFCRTELEAMAAGRNTRLRSYQTLGLCAGAALAILFV